MIVNDCMMVCIERMEERKGPNDEGEYRNGV